MLEGIEGRGGDDPRLSHPAAEELPQPTGLADRLARAGQCRADRCPEALREADRDRVEIMPPLPSRPARRHDRVHEPGAVQVHGQVMLVRPSADLGDTLDRVDPAAAAIVRVLQADQPRPDVMGVVGTDETAQVVEREEAAVAFERPRRHAREPGDPAGLPDVDVRRRAAQELVAGLRVHADGDLVGHRAGGDEDRGLLAQELGGPFLEGLDRRVVAEDVVADLRLGHRPTHAGRRPRDRVGS